MENLASFGSFLSVPKRIVVITHFKPDADALGSSLGLSGYLKKKGHLVKVVTPSDYPDFLGWMPGNEEVLAVAKEGKASSSFREAEKQIAEAEAIFCLDFSNLNRINDLEACVRKASGIKVMIDHHLEPEKFAEFEFWDITSASTAGLIYELIDALGDAGLVDEAIATCLYAGLMTDTGGFRHNNTHHREFAIASRLVKAGANPHEVAKLIYDANTLERLRLTGFVLSQKLKVLPELGTAYMTLSREELLEYGAQTGDTEGLVNYGLSIKGINLSVLMYDRGEEIKLSLRSLGNFSVNEMAKKHFAGGGHKNASGGSSKLSLQQTLDHFLAVLPTYKNEILEA